MIHKARQNAKFRRLVRRLREPLRELTASGLVDLETVVVGILERLWHETIASAPRGDIGARMDNEEIADAAGWYGDPQALIEILVETGWLDLSDEHRLVVHDWHEHAPGFVRGNVKANLGGFATDEGGPPEGLPLGQPLEGGALEGPPLDPTHITKPDLTKQNPPPPAPSSGAVVSGGWGEVEKNLQRLGVRRARRAIDSASSNGCRPEDVLDQLPFWESHRQLWRSPEGVLYERVSQLQPHHAGDEGWPPVDVELAHRAALERERAKKDREYAERYAARERRRAAAANGATR